MGNVVIRVDKLGKKYRIGRQKHYRTLRESLTTAITSPVRRLHSALLSRQDRTHRNGGEPDTIWALEDVSFEVKRGEAVGVIGRNGAGKSTLLKLLSRVTEPTKGEINILGRVGSLLEVGTGFHPELTGRENTYLNGALLGMSRREIARKFDEIVAFANIERFLDTPVKYYSSGMYMRLAFAVAAHLEPEILIVDEVLAVGDAEFQRKCLGKMGEVTHSGRTVLFVSHNMGTINRLCARAVWLDAGKLRGIGETQAIVTSYLTTDVELSGERHWPDDKTRPGNQSLRLICVRLIGPSGDSRNAFDMREPIDVEIEHEVRMPIRNMRMSIRALTEDGVTVFTTTDQNHPWHEGETRQPGRYVSRCRIPGNLLNAGYYLISAGCDIPFTEIIFFEEKALGFHVEQTGGVNSRYPERWPGVICPDLTWSLVPLGIPHANGSGSSRPALDSNSRTPDSRATVSVPARCAPSDG
jgi:lipopolysaccharide transport system ATP-binding protein